MSTSPSTPAGDPPLRGTVIVETVESHALVGNPLGDAAARRAAIWLPPSYATAPERRYPVIYWLAGYGGTGEMLFADSPWQPGLGARLDRLVSGGVMGEAIVVAPDGFTRWGGGQYVDSSALGDYETYLTRDVAARDRRPLSHPPVARRARDRRQVVGRLRRADAGDAQPRPLLGRRQPRGRHVLRALGDPGPRRRRPHAPPPRRDRRLPDQLRRSAGQGRRLVHDHDGAGVRGRLLARSRPPARRRAPLRDRDRRDRLGGLAALEGVGSGRDGGDARRGAAADAAHLRRRGDARRAQPGSRRPHLRAAAARAGDRVRARGVRRRPPRHRVPLRRLAPEAGAHRGDDRRPMRPGDQTSPSTASTSTTTARR